MTNQEFKNEYIDKDEYLLNHTETINDKNIIFFQIILLSLLGVFIFISYKLINKVFFVPPRDRKPKLLLVIYLLIVSLFYSFYYEFVIKLLFILTNNLYKI